MPPSTVQWLWLWAAIGCELVGTIALKSASAHPGVVNVGVVTAGYVASMVGLALALRAGMQVGIAYAVWSGVGTAAIAVIGAVFLGESANVWKFAFIGVIIVGVVGLNLVGE